MLAAIFGLILYLVIGLVFLASVMASADIAKKLSVSPTAWVILTIAFGPVITLGLALALYIKKS